VHTVYLEAFYMDIYEVTNAVYAKCVQAGVCTAPGETSSDSRSSYYGNSEFDNYPVIYVDWQQAQTFCKWRAARLPSEAEWEKAARGGLGGKSYPWGDESPLCQKGVANGAKFDDNQNCNATDTEPVGSYAPNGYGLFDIAGNVWEWVADWYAGYSGAGSDNPTSPDSGSFRVLRGGGWNSNELSLRASSRYNYDPVFRSDDFGFRCAASPGK
jgi:formylglycine-generating enzyme required for sulfatase activity